MCLHRVTATGWPLSCPAMKHVPGDREVKNNFVRAALNQTLVLCMAVVSSSCLLPHGVGGMYSAPGLSTQVQHSG